MGYRGHLLIWELQLVLLLFIVKSEGSAEGCPEGQKTEYVNGPCIDDDECNPEFEDEEEEVQICGENANCFNTAGSYYCQCEAGFRTTKGNINFTQETGGKCKDINECTEQNIDCGTNAKCQNNEGGYICVCDVGFNPSNGDEGFLVDQGVTCQDVDECMSGYSNCGPHAKCENNNGSYACVCEDGFVTSSGDKTCQDKDECTLNATVCGENAKCENTEGSYNCSCNHGFTFNNKTGICDEKNECEENRGICGENGECQKKPGGYDCLCKPGFRLLSGNINFNNSVEQCEDVCKLEPSICGGGACRQGANGHECHCHKGYTNSASNQEACTALKCDLLLDDINHSQSLGPELDALRSLLHSQCTQSDPRHTDAEASAQRGPLDGEALLMRLLSLLDDLLGKGLLANSEQVNVLLSSIERALKLLGPLLNAPQTKKSSNYSEVELLVQRGGLAPTGAVNLSSGSSKLGIHWETATGEAYPGFATVALLTYKNLEESTNDYFGVTPDTPNQKFQINSKVVTAAVSNENTDQLENNITLTFSHLSPEKEPHRCVYWDHGNKVWSDRGCTMVTSDADHTVCECSHLSSFAVLMALYEVEDTVELLLMTWVGLSLSLVCLLACILTFGLCRSIQSTRNTIHLHLSLSLFLASLIFLAGISRTQNQTGCAVVAGLLHFFYLAVFCWMLLEGVQLFRMVVLVFHTTLRPLYMLAAGYGPPALIVALSALLNAKGYGSKRLCWFDVTRDAFIWSFLGPVCVIIAANVFFFLITVYKLAEKFSSLNPDLNNLRKIRTFTVTAVAQLTVLGTMWIFGCFQFSNNTMPMSYLFTLFNCLQGVLMFVMHCLLNKQVREEYGKVLSCICAPQKSKYSDFTSSNQSKSQLSKSGQNTGESQI